MPYALRLTPGFHRFLSQAPHLPYSRYTVRAMWRAFTLLLLAGVLSACAPVVVRGSVGVSASFGVVLTPTFVRLEPDRGRGSVYRRGEDVRFVVSVNRPGYVALVGIDPDGKAYEFDRFYLENGTYILPLPGSQYTYLVNGGGTQRVRAIFTDTRQPTNVRFTGVFVDDDWNRRTTLYFQSSGARVRDVAETFFVIR